MSAYVPPGWPSGVHPPGTEDFERTAQAWLLDAVPADYRLHGVLRRYPLALAAMAIHHTKACVAGAREGYRTARTELGSALPPHALDAVLAAYRAEGRRLVATAQAVELVARALRGEVFTPQLQDAPPPGDRRGLPGQGAASGNQGAGTRPGAADQPGADGPPAGPGAPDELSTRRKAADGAESAAERPASDGAAKARKAQAAQRPARNGGAARRKTRSSDKQAAAG
ncbi:MAG TPA: hypothetical protein VGI05_02975 [Streptosporangiaceae bacterium]